MNEDRRTHVRRFQDRSTTVATAVEPSRLHRVSWGAIFAGVVVALATQLLLAALGLAVGLTAFDPVTQNDGGGFGIGAGVWWLLSGLIALFLGGWTAGRLANLPRKDGAIHGFATWGLATILSVWMVTSAVGGMLGGAWSAVTSAGAGAASVAQNQGGGVEEMARQLGIDPAEVRDRLQRMQSQAQTEQGRMEAQRAADQAKDVASTASWFIFGMLLLGAAASTFGGAKGSPDRYDELVETRSEAPRSSTAAM